MQLVFDCTPPLLSFCQYYVYYACNMPVLCPLCLLCVYYAHYGCTKATMPIYNHQTLCAMVVKVLFLHSPMERSLCSFLPVQTLLYLAIFSLSSGLALLCYPTSTRSKGILCCLLVAQGLCTGTMSTMPVLCLLLLLCLLCLYYAYL